MQMEDFSHAVDAQEWCGKVRAKLITQIHAESKSFLFSVQNAAWRSLHQWSMQDYTSKSGYVIQLCVIGRHWLRATASAMFYEPDFLSQDTTQMSVMFHFVEPLVRSSASYYSRKLNARRYAKWRSWFAAAQVEIGYRAKEKSSTPVKWSMSDCQHTVSIRNAL